MQSYAKATIMFFNYALIVNVHEYLKQKANYTSEKILIVPKKLIDLIDPFHKWLPIINSFVIIKISLTNLVFEFIIQKNFYSPTSLVRLI